MNEKKLDTHVDLVRSKNNKRPDVWGSILFFSELICFMSFINLPIECHVYRLCTLLIFFEF